MVPLGEIRYALRSLGKSPGYTATAIAVLALGIGANAAIFSVVDSVILKPLPYPEPERLVFVWERFPNMPDPPGARIQAAQRNYLEWRKRNVVFSDMAAFREMSLNETGGPRPARVSTGFAAANLFPLLGARARIGRVFSAEDEKKGADRVVVLTDTYFEKRFHRDPASLGQSITLDGTGYTVIGVLPAGFHLPATWQGTDQLKPDVWVPLSRLFNGEQDETSRQLLVAARLKAGVDLEQARKDMARVAEQLSKEDDKLNHAWTTSVFPFAVEDQSPTLHRALYVLLGAVGLLLLIACANLANLTLARAATRLKDVAVRLALGASRGRIVTQLLTEALLVSLAGAAAGLLVGYWCVRLMLALQPPEVVRPEYIGINLAVMGFCAGVAVLTALLFGLAPAITAAKVDLQTALKSASGWGASASRARSRQLLIAAEVALALMLLSGAGLLVRSFHQLVTFGIGFETARLMTVDVDLPEKRYPENASRSRFFEELMDRVRAIPGVRSAAVVENLPLHRVSLVNFYVAGRPEPAADALPLADFAHVSPNYFDVIGLGLRIGRGFTEADRRVQEKDGDGVAIVNETFAKKFFEGENPLGKRLLAPDKKRAFEIVGVATDYRPLGAENGSRPQIFYPYVKLRSATLVVNSAVKPQSLTKALQSAVWSLDKDIPLEKIEPMDHYVDEWQAQRKFNTLLLSLFAGLALVLAMMGIYGVLTNLVASRVREIGIRMAVGARPGMIGALVLRQSMVPVAAGAVLGIAGSLVLSRFLEALLFEVKPRDPLTLALATLGILVAAPLAIAAPVRRATRVDCTVALREE